MIIRGASIAEFEFIEGFLLLAMIDIVNYKLKIRRTIPTRNSQDPVHNVLLFINGPRLLLKKVM